MKTRPDWEVVFDMMQQTYHGGDPLENEVMKAQNIHAYYQRKVDEIAQHHAEKLELVQAVREAQSAMIGKMHEENLYYKQALQRIIDFDDDGMEEFDDPGYVAIDALNKFNRITL